MLRDGEKLSAKAGHMLQLDDRAMVRRGQYPGRFQEQEGQVVLGRFERGCDACGAVAQISLKPCLPQPQA